MTANNEPPSQHEKNRQPISASSQPILPTIGGEEKDGGENDKENEKRVSNERVERWRGQACRNEEQRGSEEIEGGGVKQRNKQEHQLNQLQNKLAEERRQTENLVEQQEELHTRQDKLQHQVESERTANTRLREECTRLKQNAEMMSRCRKKSQTVYKCLACDGTSRTW